MKASINTQPMRNGLVGSVDCEHGTRMDLIVPAPITHPVTLVGHNIVLSMFERMILQSVSVCTSKSATRLTLFFSLQVKINHMTRCNLRVYSLIGCGRQQLLTNTQENKVTADNELTNIIN